MVMITYSGPRTGLHKRIMWQIIIPPTVAILWVWPLQQLRGVDVWLLIILWVEYRVIEMSVDCCWMNIGAIDMVVLLNEGPSWRFWFSEVQGILMGLCNCIHEVRKGCWLGLAVSGSLLKHRERMFGHLWCQGMSQKKWWRNPVTFKKPTHPCKIGACLRAKLSMLMYKGHSSEDWSILQALQIAWWMQLCSQTSESPNLQLQTLSPLQPHIV